MTASWHWFIDQLADRHGWSDEERARRHHLIDNPPPEPPVGSPEWVNRKAVMHMLVERARARRAARGTRD